MKIKCLVVDDESMGRKLMEENIKQFPSLQLVATAKNAFEALQLLHEHDIDLMFLDIQMPGLSGTQFLASLKNRPHVILVTAYPQYALDGFDLDVVDYLMKPVSLERFSKAVQKVMQIEESKTTPQTQDIAAASDNSSGDFFVNVEYSLVKIAVNHILYVEGMKDYVKIHLDNQDRPIVTKSTLKNIESKLPNNSFMRVHKSYIISINKIQSIKGQQLTIGKNEIPVSESHLPDLLKRIKYNA